MQYAAACCAFGRCFPYSSRPVSVPVVVVWGRRCCRLSALCSTRPTRGARRCSFMRTFCALEMTPLAWPKSLLYFNVTFEPTRIPILHANTQISSRHAYPLLRLFPPHFPRQPTDSVPAENATPDIAAPSFGLVIQDSWDLPIRLSVSVPDVNQRHTLASPFETCR